MLRYKNIELTIDFHQWMFGFNYYPNMFGDGQAMFNLFIGPVRIGYDGIK